MKKSLRILAVLVPVVLAAIPVGEEAPGPRPAPPPPHAVDIWLRHQDVAPRDLRWSREVLRNLLTASRPPARPATPPASPPVPLHAAARLASGFELVGSVAVIEGDETTTTRNMTRYGIDYGNLAALGSRFIAAFGDHYDQLAVFLTFTDAHSPAALALANSVKNDTRGIGLGLYDASDRFGSTSGRLQNVLNMKRITVYGRDAAEDMANDLYSVWAQEAAHRWLVYFRLQREGDPMPTKDLLGRQEAHWIKGVQADASIMDGYRWNDNGDGTFTPVERAVRYGPLDQYGMGLLAEKDVPPFFLLEDIRQEDDTPITRMVVPLGGRYKARRVDLTVKDLVRANGPRLPALEPAAQDLRMGVILLTPPGVPPDDVMGEAVRLNNSRRLWDDFYNAAGGGRGKVCTELLRPCRGLSLVYGPLATLTETAAAAARDGAAAPGERVTVKIPVANVGDQARPAKVQLEAHGALILSGAPIDVPAVAAGQTTTLEVDAVVAYGTPCAEPLRIDLTTVEGSGRSNPSKGSVTMVVGALPGPIEDLEAGLGGWKVNPDGTDTARSGKWEVGTPERSEHLEFLMQPEGAWSGRNALVTGAARGADVVANDVAGGFTTVESPPLPLANLRRPSLSYQVYFVAADFDREMWIPGAGDSLRVLASADGVTWTEVDRLTGLGVGWQRRLVRLADKLPAEALAAPALRLRFVAEDTGVNDNVVEAVVDDVALIGEAPSCGLPAPDGGVAPPAPPGGGCDCRMGGPGAPHSATASAPGFLMVMTVVAGAGLALVTTRFRARRRRGRGQPRRP